MGNSWRYRRHGSADEIVGPLELHWELFASPVNEDHFEPEEVDAHELLEICVERWMTDPHYSTRWPGLMAPIQWYLDCPSGTEAPPFRYDHYRLQCKIRGVLYGDDSAADFLTSYTWPEHEVTGQPVSWVSLPVVDRFWRPEGADNGGYLQEATGWKPGPLQPFVYLPSLLQHENLGRGASVS